MPPILSSSRAALARLVSSRYHASGSPALRPGIGSSMLDWFAQTRCSSSVARIGNPSISDLVDAGKVLAPSVLNPHGSSQRRWFLGCSDGEEGNVLSKTYEERHVIGYSPEQLFSVVAAVDLYEDFVPWCQQSRIIKRNPDGSFDAELQIDFKFMIESYISHVETQKPKHIKTTASESGLFDHLINIWEFNTGPVPGTCDLYFLVDFKFKSPLYRQVASMFFKEVVPRLAGSFSDRCSRIYGPAIRVLENSYGQGGAR